MNEKIYLILRTVPRQRTLLYCVKLWNVLLLFFSICLIINNIIIQKYNEFIYFHRHDQY